MLVYRADIRRFCLLSLPKIALESELWRALGFDASSAHLTRGQGGPDLLLCFPPKTELLLCDVELRLRSVERATQRFQMARGGDAFSVSLEVGREEPNRILILSNLFHSNFTSQSSPPTARSTLRDMSSRAPRPFLFTSRENR